jgi:2-keto-myo-inositol isomerase
MTYDGGMKPCLSEATTMPHPFAADVAACAEAGCRALEVWLTKLEQHLQTQPADDSRKLLADRGVQLVAASYQGGLLFAPPDRRQAHAEQFLRRLDLCQRFGIPTLVVVGDFPARVGPGVVERAAAGLARAAQWAAGFGVTLALEFQAGAGFCTNLETALALVRACGQPNLGVCLDVFHYYKGPSKAEDLERLTPSDLALVQVCDVAGVPRELATDADRVLPGDGDFLLEPLLGRLRALGYDGWVSLELLNPVLWQSHPAQVAELGFAALRRVLPP